MDIAPQRTPGTIFVFSGGLSLGSFAAGAFEAFASTPHTLRWLAGSSSGAVTAALIAGSPPGRQAANLARFWDAVTTDPTPALSFWFGPPSNDTWRQASNQASVLQTLTFGRPGLFRPRLAPAPRAGAPDVSGLYDLQPLREHLLRLVDFARLNDGGLRVTLVATDVQTGERVVFDTARGTRIGPEHVLASSAMMPIYAPIEVEGRLLADGGLSTNAPVDIVLADPASDGMTCYVIDLFAREGSRPHTLGASLSRATDLAFGNQTWTQLEAIEREAALRRTIARLGALLPDGLAGTPEIAPLLAEGRAHGTNLILVAFRASIAEAGPTKLFDFSDITMQERWTAGATAMQDAMREPPAKASAMCPAPACAAAATS